MTNATASPPERRGSSLLAMARKSFSRTSGERGASAEVLRGSSGSDFESMALICRGGMARGGCSCVFGGSDKGEKFVMLKGPFCFVYKAEDSATPLYAVNLVDLKAESKGTTALLQTQFGDTEYELRFDKEGTAKNFATTVGRLAASGKTDEVRKRLGHEHLLNQHTSMKFAASIAEKKIDDAPSAPLNHEEMMANIPVNAL